MSEHSVWPKSERFCGATSGITWLVYEKYCRCCARRVNFREHHIDIAGGCHSDIVCYFVVGISRASIRERGCLRVWTWNVLVYGGVMFGIARKIPLIFVLPGGANSVMLQFTR